MSQTPLHRYDEQKYRILDTLWRSNSPQNVKARLVAGIIVNNAIEKAQRESKK